MSLTNCSWTMARETLEDERGVDVVRIRELLAMTPAQRVEHMVQVINSLQAVSAHAREARG